MKPRTATGVVALLLAACPITAVGAEDHPFTLVNIIDLFDAFSFDAGIVIDGGGLFPGQNDPGNVPPVSELRLGTNPSAVATDGTRAWIAGYYNAGDFAGNTVLSWYASVGVGEITNIYGSSFPLPLVRYEDTLQVGPGVAVTDWFSGLDFDEQNQILYVAFDDANRFASGGLFDLLSPPQTQETSYIAAVDVNTNSATYGTELWRLDQPSPDAIDGIKVRLTGGVAVDPLDPQWISAISFPSGLLYFYDTLNLAGTPITYDLYDSPLTCPSSAFGSQAFDPGSGDYYVRARNGVQRLPRNAPTAPFAAYARFIIEPDAGSNGTADTTAQGDDVQEIGVGAAVSAGDIIISPGPNGFLDTSPAAGDVFSSRVVSEGVVGNKPGSYNCGDDDDGFLYTNVTQGQGMAYIDASNLVDLDEDLILASGRANFGANQLKDIRFFNTNGDTVAELELPCTPVPTSSNGLAFYAVDYHAPSGTLVVLEFEQRKLYVFKAQTTGGAFYPRYDYNRNGKIDLYDFARLQGCFTGPEPANVLTPNCQRLNADSDCDIDLDDWAIIEPYFDTLGGPG